MKIIKSGLALALSLTVAVAGCTVEDPEVLDTHSGEWETVPFPGYDEAPIYEEQIGPPEPGWQCDGQPCTEDQLQHLVKTLEVVGGGN